MPRVAVISDIHGNLHALRAVLEAIHHARIRDIVCLGDIVGYGPHPGLCIDLVMEHCHIVIRGNHEDAVVDPACAAGFNATARHAIDWTRNTLSPEQRETLRMLPAVATLHRRVLCVHDSPTPGPTGYLHNSQLAALAFRGLHTPICLVGHTHVPMVFEAPSRLSYPEWEEIASYGLRDGSGHPLNSGRRYICNPGSVGQPRDSDPRASWAVLDLDRAEFILHRVEYDIEAAKMASRRAGLPARLGERLAIGA